MATTYTFKGMANQIPYDAFGFAVLKKNINIGELVASGYGKLALASAPTVGLTSFSGFAGASSDVLQVFGIPAGTLVTGMGIRISSADTNAATAALGDGNNTAGWGAAKAINATGNQITLKNDAYGPDNVSGVLYTAADTLDILFASATAIDAVLDVWAIVQKVY